MTTDEAEARRSLLAHYENKLETLKAHVVTLTSELARKTDPADRRALMVQIGQREAVIAKIEGDASRLREPIKGG